MLSLAFCQAIAAFFVDIFHGGAGDWDPQRNKAVGFLYFLSCTFLGTMAEI